MTNDHQTGQQPTPDAAEDAAAVQRKQDEAGIAGEPQPTDTDAATAPDREPGQQ